MNNHEASEQMLGYLYQIRYALYLLLNSPDERMQIAIEKFDDVSFGHDDKPEALIQLKHHTKSNGNLTDASSDIWRTLKAWIGAIKKESDLLESTKFLIITTASAPKGSAAHFLKPDSQVRDTDAAYNILDKVSKTSTNKEHIRLKFYSEFNSLSEPLRKKLINQIHVIDKEKNIVNIEEDIKQIIKYSCSPENEELILEQIEGWWFKKAIKALSSETPIFTLQNQVRSHIVSVSQQYTKDNLPINDDLEFLEIDLSDKENRVFREQLKLICIGSNRMRVAIEDYYRAYKQRSNWIRNDLLHINELERYEERLIDEWNHAFSDMQDDLEGYATLVSEDDKIRRGKELFRNIDKLDIRIRPRCSDAFVMRGSYHMLSSQLKIGWHVDFFNRLKDLLGEV